MWAVYGDGLSARRGEVDVTLGHGNRCRILASNVSHVICMTGPKVDVVSASTIPVALRIRGQPAVCAAEASQCSFTYDWSTTAIVHSAVVEAKGDASWQIRVQGDYFNISAAPIIRAGPTLCRLTEFVSSKELVCSAPPLMVGSNMISLQTSWGVAAATPHWYALRDRTLRALKDRVPNHSNC